MIHTIILMILGCLIIANLVVLINVSNNPMYNAMDNYNTSTDATIKDMKYVPGRVGVLRNDVKHMEKRLSSLEDKFAYHIQSTDEFKSK